MEQAVLFVRGLSGLSGFSGLSGLFSLSSWSCSTKQTRQTKQRFFYAGGLFQHPARLSEPSHEKPGLQPQQDGGVRGSAGLGIISVLFLLFPSPPGKEIPHRRTDEANPCQRRRFCKQPNGKSGIDHCSDKVEVPRNLALFFQWCAGLRCHSSAPMRPVRPNYV